MASYFNSAGSKVTVIEMLDHIAGPTDSEISSILLNSYKKKGVDFKLSAKVTEITDSEVLLKHRKANSLYLLIKYLPVLVEDHLQKVLALKKSALKLCEVE